jgi:hypothetical protein
MKELGRLDMQKSQQIDGDQLLASAVAYLIEGGDTYLAEQLCFCTVEDVFTEHVDDFGDGRVEFRLGIRLRGPRAACDLVNDGFGQESRTAWEAFAAALPYGDHLSTLQARATIHVPDANWRTELLELAKGKGVSNQAVGADSSHLWQGFKFRSASEIKIAGALDRAGLLFFPLPKARVSPAEKDRLNVEPDFVICDEGRWGILEVDGAPFHPPQRSAIEHNRDRMFKRHGVVCVERFDSNRCFNEPDKVVEEFRLLMVKAYRRP